jgi:hypothetical protein
MRRSLVAPNGQTAPSDAPAVGDWPVGLPAALATPKLRVLVMPVRVQATS